MTAMTVMIQAFRTIHGALITAGIDNTEQALITITLPPRDHYSLINAFAMDSAPQRFDTHGTTLGGMTFRIKPAVIGTDRCADIAERVWPKLFSINEPGGDAETIRAKVDAIETVKRILTAADALDRGR